jgi:hypothetical protein
MITYVAQQRITRDGLAGRWNDLPGADTIQGARDEIDRNIGALANVEGVMDGKSVEYRIVQRDDRVIIRNYPE